MEIRELLGAMDVYDPYTSGHGERVAVYAREIARALGFSIDEQRRVHWAGRLHDIGKLWVPLSVLQKADELTPTERRVMQTHAQSGFQILSESGLEDVGRIVEQHHERIDGQGYPAGCLGDQIDPIALIISVADTYDAMTSDRVYRPALGRAIAMAELRRVAGTQLDARAVGAFLDLALSRAESKLGRAPGRRMLEEPLGALPGC